MFEVYIVSVICHGKLDIFGQLMIALLLLMKSLKITPLSPFYLIIFYWNISTVGGVNWRLRSLLCLSNYQADQFIIILYHVTRSLDTSAVTHFSTLGQLPPVQSSSLLCGHWVPTITLHSISYTLVHHDIMLRESNVWRADIHISMLGIIFSSVLGQVVWAAYQGVIHNGSSQGVRKQFPLVW